MTIRVVSPRALIVAALSAVLALAVGCASAPPARMHRALDASMERVLRTETYLRSVAGISSYPSRLTRGDGFVYISDVAPILRYLAEVRDTVRFRALRSFTTDKMIRRGPSGFEIARRYREGEAFQAATSYGYVWTTQALAEGWRLLGDTASASVLAQLAPPESSAAQSPSEMYRLSLACGDAMDVVAFDTAPARAVLKQARTLVGSAKAATEQAALGVTAVEGEVDLLSCLTRMGIAVQDPDATVRYLDRLLDLMAPLVVHSGRPDMGSAADVLLTLRRVREAGPEYAR
jgi:hypothetical protein